jgi:conjugal transfer pilin signal peptidase TrbI
MKLIFLNSASVPFKVCLQVYNLKPKKGDLCSFDFKGRTFVKYMVGISGDEIQRVGRVVYVGEARVGEAKETELLSPIEEGKILEGYVFMAGTHPDSLDSRYKEFGLIKESDIRGRAFGLVAAPDEEIALWHEGE